MFAMGLIAGICGIIAALISMFIGGVAEAFGGNGSQIGGLGIGALLFSILGIIGAVMIKSKPKLAGAFMLVAGIGGLICISFFYILSAILFVIPGFVGLFAKKQSKTLEV